MMNLLISDEERYLLEKITKAIINAPETENKMTVFTNEYTYNLLLTLKEKKAIDFEFKGVFNDTYNPYALVISFCKQNDIIVIHTTDKKCIIYKVDPKSGRLLCG